MVGPKKKSSKGGVGENNYISKPIVYLEEEK